MKKYLMEGVGTFVLALLVMMTANQENGSQMPYVYAAVLTGLLYAGFHVSRAHFNPAVSVADLILGRLERWDFPYYWIAQIAGSILAVILGAFLLRCGGTIEMTHLTYDPFCAFFAELVGCFALTFVYLHTTTSTSESAVNSYFGIATGSTLLASIYAFHNISLAVFNPILVLMLAFNGSIAWGESWSLILGQLVGAAAAASVFRSINPNTDQELLKL